MSEPNVEDVIRSADELLKNNSRARQLFEQLKDKPREVGIELEVSVVGKSEYVEFDANVEARHGKSFDIGIMGELHTTEKPPEHGSPDELAHKFGKALIKNLDESSGSTEEGLHQFTHTISTRELGGLEPEIGDILIQLRRGGFFGRPVRSRLVKLAMSETEERQIIDFMSSPSE